MEDYGSVTLKAKEKQKDNNIANFAFKLTRQMPYPQEVIERSLVELADEGVIIIEGDRLYQKRMVRDGELSRKRAEAGSKGGKGSRNQPTDSKTASKTRSKTEANTEIEYENEAETEIEGGIKDGSSKPSLIEERFEQWWASYPRKVGKGNAKKIFLKIAPDKALFEKMMTTLEKAKHCEQWSKEHGQFIPHPSTWLGQGRWDDEYGASEGAAHDDTPFDWNGDNPYEKWGT
jgi:hypothetical protein